MSVLEEFAWEIQEFEQTLDIMKKFVESNNENVELNTYYLSLGTKNFLQTIEDTFENPTLDKNEKKEHFELIKTFLEKVKNFYPRISESDEYEVIELKRRIEDSSKFLGFAGENDVYSSLESTLLRLENKEILS